MKRILLLALIFSGFSSLIIAQSNPYDSSFGKNGLAITNLGNGYNYGTPPATQILLQPDGSMYIMQLFLSKRLANGSLDKSFGHDGFAGVEIFDKNIAALEPDGKIVAAITHYKIIYRCNTDGSLDSSFSGDGKLNTDIENITSLVIQSDGKIVVAGFNYRRSGTVSILQRFNLDGSLDSTFNGDGENTKILFIPQSTAIQSDGKIVVAGKKSGDFALARYNTKGNIDSTFSDDGIQTTDLGSYSDRIKEIAIQSDGKIVAAGKSNGHFALARYNTDGSLDNSFSGDGKQITALSKNDVVNTINLQADGKIVIGGSYTDSLKIFTILRYNSNGSLDNTFSNGGIQTTSFIAYNNEEVESLAIRPDGRIVAGGGTSFFLALARYNTDGSLDNSLNRTGKLTDENRLSITGFKSVVVQKDGKVIGLGTRWNGRDNDFTVARYNLNGSPDKTFGKNGLQTTNFSTEYDEAHSVVLQKDEKIVAAGGYALARYNTDGSLDNTFSTDGKQTTHSVYINAAAIQSDGKIVVTGQENFKTKNSYDGNPVIVRYNSDGSLDKTFGVGGKQSVIINGLYGNSSYLVIQSSGKIVVASLFKSIEEPYAGTIIITRLNADGSFDNTFGTDGSKKFTSGDYADTYTMNRQNDDKIVVAGVFYKSGSGGAISLIRYNADGSLDSSFNGISNFRQDYYYRITSMDFQSDGKIIVAGADFTRYYANGLLDPTFQSIGLGDILNDITIADDKLYTAEETTPYGIITKHFLYNEDAPPTVSLTAPADNQYYLEPAVIKLTAAASDIDGTISKVEFYNGTTLLHTEYQAPFAYQWRNVPAGYYTLTARATDNNGKTSTSAAIHITVVSKDAFNVRIVNPVNNEVYAAPGYIHLKAQVNNPTGKIAWVEFFNGFELLRTEYKYPYTYVWKNIPEGTYYITAKAADDQGNITTSETITVKVVSPKTSIVSNRPYSKTEKTALNDALSLRLSPNPANDIINIQTIGLQPDKPVTLSVISASGIVMKTMQISSLSKTFQLDVSSFVNGVYTVKLIDGNNIIYKQFVKL